MNKLLSIPIVRIISVVGLFLLIRYFSKELARLISDLISDNYIPNFSFESSIYKLFMVVFSFTIMIAIPGYTLKDFGFRRPEKVNYFKILWVTFAIVIGGAFIFGALYMGVLNNIFGDGQQTPIDLADEQSFLSIVLSIWIWSSLTEEIYTRGLFQSLIDNLKKYTFIKLSIPVWLSGLLFGLLHFSLYSPDKLFFTLFIVTQTTILGILAAYYREKSKSIYPAFLIHILANIYGSFMMLIG